ncbi:hypothetical protein MMC14_007215 [Varicellaria rhodocarpa]|nr:hypothetical protein [Varicellaria rhodocarpa]
MHFKTTVAILGVIASISRVATHGTVSGVVADGVYYQGYSPSMKYQTPSPKVVGWSIPEDLSNGFIDPNNYTLPDIICHLGATPGQATASVKAGGIVKLLWTPWPVSHHGPVIDYLANCNGECTTVDKTVLKFNKIDGVGLIDDNSTPGTWATDQLIANNNSWTVTIPKSIAPGNYVLRHEIIALHSAGTTNGAQNYPQCINLQVTGSGNNSIKTGTLGEALYTPSDAGILVNIYTTLTSYLVPGPAMISDAISTSQGNGTDPAPIASSSASVASSAAPFTSAPAVTSALAVTSSDAANGALSDSSITQAPSSITTATPSEPTTPPFPISAPLPIISAIANLTSAIPTGALTSTLPAEPTSGAGSNATGTLPPAPSTPLPAGITLKELLEWLEIIIMGMFREAKAEDNSARGHARAF